MNNNFEKDLDEAIKKWPENVVYYTWEEVFKDEYGKNMKLHLLNRLADDKLIKSNGADGYCLTSQGYDVKRNIEANGYVAQRKKEREKEEREITLFHLSKQ